MSIMAGNMHWQVLRVGRVQGAMLHSLYGKNEFFSDPEPCMQRSPAAAEGLTAVTVPH
jgi:hypothetical protein